MSEYQYYDFRAIDKPLDQDEMDDLRSLSSRAEITSFSLTNEYSYGSFRGKSEDLMSRLPLALPRRGGRRIASRRVVPTLSRGDHTEAETNRRR
jgi:hypothetical protein